MSTIGERLREERIRLGYNQPGFAVLAGLKKQAQINYEKGARHPDSEYLSAIAEAGADIQYIVTGRIGVLHDPSSDLEKMSSLPEKEKNPVTSIDNGKSELDVQRQNSVPTSTGQVGTTESVDQPVGMDEKEPKEVGTISEEEAALVRKYRQLPSEERTHAQAVVGALADASSCKSKLKVGGSDQD